MKISKGYIVAAFKVKEKESNKIYDCFIQDYEYENGTHKARFNIGINGWSEWNFRFYLAEDEFNEKFEIL